jgi:hypothetical protein
VKTTLEIPDRIFHRAKFKAAQQGVPLRQFVTEAIEEKLRATPEVGAKPWMKHMGQLKGLRKETRRIDKVIAHTFEKVDAEMWSSEQQD